MSNPPPSTADTWSGVVRVDTEQAMLRLGECLGRVLRAGDLVLLDGPLGAGKTTVTRGIAAGLGVRGPVTSPTFVIAREHPPHGTGTGLLHVDAYRLGGPDEVEDLDLPLADAVTVVEWGGGVAGHLSRTRLELTLQPEQDESRTVTWRAVGPRWRSDVSRVAGCAGR